MMASADFWTRAIDFDLCEHCMPSDRSILEDTSDLSCKDFYQAPCISSKIFQSSYHPQSFVSFLGDEVSVCFPFQVAGNDYPQ